MYCASKTGFSSVYHWEAAISSEHARAPIFEKTNWELILHYYRSLYALKPSEQIVLNQVVVLLQLNRLDHAEELFLTVEVAEGYKVLYHSIGSELYLKKENAIKALKHLDLAERSSPTPAESLLIKRKKKNLM
jgi:RNA polymerase sigma-70 factor (ECF subfamily)